MPRCIKLDVNSYIYYKPRRHFALEEYDMASAAVERVADLNKCSNKEAKRIMRNKKGGRSVSLPQRGGPIAGTGKRRESESK